MNTTEQKFDLEYFINKYENIDEKLWCTGAFQDVNGCKCAYGHLGMTTSHEFDEIPECVAIDSITTLESPVSQINDNSDGKYTKYGSTPKQRVVNYLKSLR